MLGSFPLALACCMLMSESVEITGVTLCPGSGYATRCVTKQGLTRCLSLALTRNGLPYVEAFTELPGCNNQMKDIYAADQYILKLCGLQEDSIGREMRLQCSDYRSVLLAHVTSAEIVVDQTRMQVSLQPRVQFTAEAVVKEIMPMLDHGHLILG